MLVTTLPDEKVSNENSLLVSGYAFKPNSEATMKDANGGIPKYSQNDGAWFKNAAVEARLVDAMRKAPYAVIKAQTSKGTQTTDTFSLKGISQALARVTQECR